MRDCEIEGCGKKVPKAEHRLCYEHWKMEQEGNIKVCEGCGKYKDNSYPLCTDCYHRDKNRQGQPKGFIASVKSFFSEDDTDDGGQSNAKLLSSTALGKSLNLSNVRVNQILSELGWITKERKGWTTTRQGKSKGGEQREMRDTGIPYVKWPKSILENKDLNRTVKIYKGGIDESEKLLETKNQDVSFREKFPATLRANDGHLVRSRGEMLIDNFLYMQNIVHAYERKVPIDEDLYCDFYLPGGKVYIEYWGLEGDSKYEARKTVKETLYSKYGLKLIELSDKHIENLDDHFPKLLLQFGIPTD